MTLFNKIGDTISANVNEAVENVGRPDIMAKYYAEKANAELDKARNRAASVVAERKAIERDIATTKDEITEMQVYAEKAMQAGNKEDARAFLQTKNDLSVKLDSLERALTSQKASEEIVIANYQNQSKEVAAMEADVREISANVTVAASKDASGTYASNTATRATRMFRRMKAKAQKMVDEASAKEEIMAANAPVASLKEKYASPSNVDTELAALEAKYR